MNNSTTLRKSKFKTCLENATKLGYRLELNSKWGRRYVLIGTTMTTYYANLAKVAEALQASSNAFAAYEGLV